MNTRPGEIVRANGTEGTAVATDAGIGCRVLEATIEVPIGIEPNGTRPYTTAHT